MKPITTTKERNLVFIIVVLGGISFIALGVHFFIYNFLPLSNSNQDNILLNKFEITQQDYQSINNLMIEKDYLAVSICNLKSEKCSIMYHLDNLNKFKN